MFACRCHARQTPTSSCPLGWRQWGARARVVDDPVICCQHRHSEPCRCAEMEGDLCSIALPLARRELNQILEHPAQKLNSPGIHSSAGRVARRLCSALREEAVNEAPWPLVRCRQSSFLDLTRSLFCDLDRRCDDGPRGFVKRVRASLQHTVLGHCLTRPFISRLRMISDSLLLVDPIIQKSNRHIQFVIV